MTKIFKCPFQ